MNHLRHEPSGHDDIGPYRLLGSIGRGGMAEVFLAEHRHLSQVRAVKLVLPEVSQRSGLVGRLLTEARATARLRHPAIVQVFDCDTLPQGGAFIAMEYLEGEPLSGWLGRAGGLGGHPILAAAITGVVAEGLAFAHDNGVVHRDIKPENLFLVPDAQRRRRFSVRILDFGVAKLLGEEPLITTRDGTVIGTPVYMAPEQWRPGAAVDPRADIYSLGCVMFELIAGRPPFSCADGWQIMYAHLSEAPQPLATVVPAVPDALAQLVAAMLAKSPDDRPQTMTEVIRALASFLGCAPGRFDELLLAPSHAPIASANATGTHDGGTRSAPVEVGARGTWSAEGGAPATMIVSRGFTRDRMRKPLSSLAIAVGVIAAGVAAFLLIQEPDASAPAPAAARAPVSAPRPAPRVAIVPPASAPVATPDLSPPTAAFAAPPPRPASAVRPEVTAKKAPRVARKPTPPVPRSRAVAGPTEPSDSVYLPVAD